MELFDYLQTARAKQLDLARAYRNAELAGTVKVRSATSRHGWFGRFAFRGSRPDSPGASPWTLGGEA